MGGAFPDLPPQIWPFAGGTLEGKGLAAAVAEASTPTLRIPGNGFPTRDAVQQGRHQMANTTSTTAQPSAAIPPDDVNRKLTVATPKTRRCATSRSWAALTRSS